MKELWDEIDIHLSLPVCTCGAAKAFNKHLEDDKTHKFLMDLDSTKYENARSNLLALDPLPKLNKVYAAITRDEQQRNITREAGPKPLMEAAALKVTVSDKGRQGKATNPRCTHCQKLGHEKHQCF